MKHLNLTLILFFFSSFCFSQKITSENFDETFDALLENLYNENWKNSEKICDNLLIYAEPIDSMDTEKKVLRYIKIYSTAGLLNDNKITKKDALKRTKHLKGKDMIMPAHPFISKSYINCIQLNEDEKDTFFTGVNNKQGTQIFSFEYVKIKDGIKETKSELEGKYIILKGNLDEISIEGNMLPRFKLKFKNGEYEFTTN